MWAGILADIDGAVLKEGKLVTDPRRAHVAGYVFSLFLEIVGFEEALPLSQLDKLSLVTRPYF